VEQGRDRGGTGTAAEVEHPRLRPRRRVGVHLPEDAGDLLGVDGQVIVNVGATEAGGGQVAGPVTGQAVEHGRELADARLGFGDRSAPFGMVAGQEVAQVGHGPTLS
jgi:hypothetical protein